MNQETKLKQYVNGLKAAGPAIFGFFPVGIAFAIIARQAGLTIFQTCLMSLSVFAGASQMMAVGMLMTGASLFAMVLATFIINLRHVIMSICVFTRMPPLPVLVRFLLGFGVTDESFALFTTTEEKNCTPYFFLGLFSVNYISYNLGVLFGAVVNDFLPEMITASLGISLYAMFIGLLVPNLPGNAKLAGLALGTAFLNWLLSAFMAPSWAMIASTLICALIGVFVVDLGESFQDTMKREPSEEYTEEVLS